MAGQGFLTRNNGRTTQKFATQTSAGSADAGKVPALNSAGQIDTTMMPTGIGANVVSAVASEAITAGSFVQLYQIVGTPNTMGMRNADNSTNREAWGYVQGAVASAATGTVYRLGTANTNMTGLTIGGDYWLGTTGGVITAPLDSTVAGKTDQYLGRAQSATTLVTEQYEPILL